MVSFCYFISLVMVVEVIYLPLYQLYQRSRTGFGTRRILAANSLSVRSCSRGHHDVVAASLALMLSCCRAVVEVVYHRLYSTIWSHHFNIGCPYMEATT
jgi:hypothetical protein